MSQKAKHCNKVLSQCFIQYQNIPSHIDVTTTIICNHKKDVKKQYHGPKQTFSNCKTYEIKMDTNATNIEPIQ
jgi:hypothetical protein